MRSIEKSSEIVTQLAIPAIPTHLARIRQLAYDIANRTSLTEDEVQDFCLAVMEAVTNAVRHSESKDVKVVFETNSNRITAKIIDGGCGFQFHPQHCAFPELDEQGGRGIPLMNNLVDLFEIKTEPGCGTEVTLIKRTG